MKNMYEVIKEYSRYMFNADLDAVYKRFNIPVRFVLPRQWVENELKARKTKEEKRDKFKEIPLIGKMIYKHLSKNYCESSSETEFLLKLMDKLGLTHLTVDSIGYIMDNEDEIYEKHFRGDYEYKLNAKVSSYLANCLEK